jgi:hypothetical protein
MRLAGQSLTVILSLVGSNTSLLRCIQHNLLALSNTNAILYVQCLHLPTSRYQISLATSETHPSDGLICPSRSLRNFRLQWKLIHAKKYDRIGTSGKLGTLRYALRRRSSKAHQKQLLIPVFARLGTLNSCCHCISLARTAIIPGFATLLQK